MADSIDTILKETRSFEPSQNFQNQANLKREEYLKIVERSRKDPVGFWEESANALTWEKRWDTPLEWKPPFAKWFVGATLNASLNCLDRQISTGRGKKLALIWEGEDGQVKQLTYQQLFEEVCQLANALEKDLKLKPADTAAIYLPLIPEAVIAMLACARIGVTHSVIFAGFSSQSIHDRVKDAECKVIFTCDVGYRKGTELELQKTVATAIKDLSTVKHVVCLRRKEATVLGEREIDWHELTGAHTKNHQAKAFDSEHPLFFLYTSGTTGKPKGIVHSTGGYLVGVSTTAKWIFDLKESDIYWCTADIGWVTGHSYVVYGILANGGTNVIYEGNPAYPHPGRIWEIIDKHKVTILYTAPTAIRAFMRSGDQYPNQYRLDSLRLLGTVGEPINPEAWLWYRKVIGKDRCPIVDTWWQTETGAIMIAPIPGVTATPPASATQPFPGILADVVNESGKSCSPNEGGYLVINHPWPSMLRTIYKDPQRYESTYWSKFPGKYFAGDGAHKDEKGNFWIMGRVDDVINVSGHRLGTMEIESALVSHPAVAEAAVVGRSDALKGQAIVAFVIPKQDVTSLEGLAESLKKHVSEEIGTLARPEEIKFTKSLPKTRSGKIMRRLLKDLAEGKEPTGDKTTLENPTLIELL